MKSKSLEDCLSAVVELTKGLPEDTYKSLSEVSKKLEVHSSPVSSKKISPKDVRVLLDVLYGERCIEKVVVGLSPHQVLGYRPNFKGIERSGYAVTEIL